MGPFLSTKTADFHLVHSINVLGTYLTMREVSHNPSLCLDGVCRTHKAMLTAFYWRESLL